MLSKKGNINHLSQCVSGNQTAPYIIIFTKLLRRGEGESSQSERGPHRRLARFIGALDRAQIIWGSGARALWDAEAARRRESDSVDPNDDRAHEQLRHERAAP